MLISGVFGQPQQMKPLTISKANTGAQIVLAATVLAPDGLIEGIEGVTDAFVLAVQWHPEMLIESDAGTRRLFEEFRAAATEYSLRSGSLAGSAR